jgi:cytochrome P450
VTVHDAPPVPDVFDPRQYATGVPYDAYRVLRDHHPVARQDEPVVLGWPAGPGFWEVTRRDTRLAGRHIRAGDKVVVFHASANRDERVFTAPDRLDPSRAPNPHVSFGDGPHVCLGAHFARLQLSVLYREAVRVLPLLGTAGPPRRLVSNFINGLKSLPVRLV